jgi:hypothetical protein
MNIDNEIRELKEKLDRLENVKKEMERTKNKNISVEDNLTVIHNIIKNKKLAIMKNKYSKVVPLSSYYDSELVAHLEATYNILRELNFAIKNK